MAAKKALDKILRGSSDANIPFDDVRRVLRSLGSTSEFAAAIIIFSREGVEEILNRQPKSSKAKLCQVKQVRQVILKYRMGGAAHAKTQV